MADAAQMVIPNIHRDVLSCQLHQAHRFYWYRLVTDKVHPR